MAGGVRAEEMSRATTRHVKYERNTWKGQTHADGQDARMWPAFVLLCVCVCVCVPECSTACTGTR